MFPIRGGGTSNESANNIEGTHLFIVKDIGGKRFKSLLFKVYEHQSYRLLSAGDERFLRGTLNNTTKHLYIENKRFERYEYWTNYIYLIKKYNAVNRKDK